MRAQVTELSQCLNPDKAGKQMGLTDRQVRNLIHDGKLKGVIAMGKKRLIPWDGLREYLNGQGGQA